MNCDLKNNYFFQVDETSMHSECGISNPISTTPSTPSLSSFSLIPCTINLTPLTSQIVHSAPSSISENSTPTSYNSTQVTCAAISNKRRSTLQTEEIEVIMFFFFQ